MIITEEAKEVTGRYNARTGNLGVVLPADKYISNEPYYQECIEGICEAAALLDYSVMLVTATENDFTKISTLVENEKVDGLILIRSMKNDKVIQYLVEKDCMVGVTGASDYQEVIQVDVDWKDATETLTTFLLEEGYRRFAFIVENLDYTVDRCRYEGFKRALQKKGLEAEKQHFVNGFITADTVDYTISNMIKKKVDCAICADDVICARLMSGLQSGGYRIPRDIAVASLYSSSNLRYFNPLVTTVNVSAKQMGSTICKQMIYCLTGKEYQKKTILDYEILVRRSTNALCRET